jgi:hypothetical protein
MATPHESLTGARQLGSYGGAGGVTGTPRDEARAVDKDAVEMARACAGCGKHIKKVDRSLVCSCKQAIHCSSDCQQSSDHRATCTGSETNFCLAEMDSTTKLMLLVRKKVHETGPSRDRLEQLQKRAKKPADVMALAKAWLPSWSAAPSPTGGLAASRGAATATPAAPGST